MKRRQFLTGLVLAPVAPVLGDLPAPYCPLPEVRYAAPRAWAELTTAQIYDELGAPLLDVLESPPDVAAVQRMLVDSWAKQAELRLKMLEEVSDAVPASPG